jgi:pimeloyl-ACP methyl ester carboxylesterase
MRRRAPLLLGTGAALAAMALFVQYRTKKAEQENLPSGKFIEVDGVCLHYVERGQGQPVVLLHGNGTMAKELDVSGVLDLASKKYRVIAFDRSGYGYSERPRTTIWNPTAQAHLLYRALQHLGIEQPVVVGHSWGTMVATALALEQPEYVRSLLLLSGYYYPTPRVDVLLFSPPALPVIGDLMHYTISPLLGRLFWPAMVRIDMDSKNSRNSISLSVRASPSSERASSCESASGGKFVTSGDYGREENLMILTAPKGINICPPPGKL